MSKEELKKLKTWNGKAIHTEDVRKVFSILKTLLKLWGHKSYIVFGDTPPAKDKCIEMIHQLFDEYADNKYMATVVRARKRYTREICLWGIATVGWGLLGVALACLWWR